MDILQACMEPARTSTWLRVRGCCEQHWMQGRLFYPRGISIPGGTEMMKSARTWSWSVIAYYSSLILHHYHPFLHKSRHGTYQSAQTWAPQTLTRPYIIRADVCQSEQMLLTPTIELRNDKCAKSKCSCLLRMHAITEKPLMKKSAIFTYEYNEWLHWQLQGESSKITPEPQ